MEGAEPEPEYEVGRLLLRERPIANSDRREYLVQRVGRKEPTWEPEENIDKAMIKDFRHEQASAGAGAGQSEGGQKRPGEESEGTTASEAAAKPPKQHAAPAARRAKPAEQLVVPERAKREKKTPRAFVAEPAPPAAALRRYALEASHLTPSEATDVCTSTVVGGQRVPMQGTKLAAARTKKRAAEPGTAAAGEASGKAPKAAKAPGAEVRAPAEDTDKAAAEATVVAAAQAAGVAVSGVASPDETSVAAWPAAWTEAVDDEEDELDAGRRARQAKREEQRLRQTGVAHTKPSDTAARAAAPATTPDEPGAAVTTMVAAVASSSPSAAPGTKGKRTTKPSAAEGVVGASSNVCERCGKSFQQVRGLRTHRNYCKDDPADGPRLVTAQQASAALVVALPASLALTSKLALWRPDDEISEETAAHAEQTRRENEKLVVTLEQQKLTAFGEQLRNVKAQLQRAKTDQALAQGVVETRENQLMLLDKRKAMELGRSSLREAQAGFDEKLSELNDTDEQQKECQARLHALLRNAGAEEIAEAALALQAQENDRAVPALLAES